MSRSSYQNISTALEFAPILLYFVVYVTADRFVPANTQPIFVATAVFIIVTLVAVFASLLIVGKLPVMPLVSAIPLTVLGVIGILLKDDTFIKIRPTVVNLLFAAILLGGLAFRRALLRYIFSTLIDVTDEGWRKLTVRWGVFCLVMGIANELVWRLLPEGIWVIYDAWISTALTFIFTIAQYPLILAYENRS